jgi:hypothetical protein
VWGCSSQTASRRSRKCALPAGSRWAVTASIRGGLHVVGIERGPGGLAVTIDPRQGRADQVPGVLEDRNPQVNNRFVNQSVNRTRRGQGETGEAPKARDDFSAGACRS